MKPWLLGVTVLLLWALWRQMDTGRGAPPSSRGSSPLVPPRRRGMRVRRNIAPVYRNWTARLQDNPMIAGIEG